MGQRERNGIAKDFARIHSESELNVKMYFLDY